MNREPVVYCEAFIDLATLQLAATSELLGMEEESPKAEAVQKAIALGDKESADCGLCSGLMTFRKGKIGTCALEAGIARKQLDALGVNIEGTPLHQTPPSGTIQPA